MRKNSSNMGEKNRTIGMLAIVAFLMLFASTLGVGWVSLSAVAGTSDIDEMGDPVPEPAGGWGSGWINDVLTEGLGVDCRDSAMATGPGGNLHLVFACDVTVGGWNVFYSTSTDGGETWSPQGLVAGTADAETSPDIAVHPDDGRIFVAYEQLVGPGDLDILIAYSDDGTTWVAADGDGYVGFNDRNPAVTIEHNIGSPFYYVYVSFETEVDPDNINMIVSRSTDRGVSYTRMLNQGASDANVYADADICYQRGTDALDYLFVVFTEGVDAATVFSITVMWSTDYGVTWNPRYTVVTETDLVRDPSIAGSRDGDKLVIAYADANAGDQSIRYSYDHDPTTPDAGWSTLTRGNTATNTMVDGAPEVKADGEGTMDVTIGGLFHLIWSQGAPDYNVMYSTSTSTGTGFAGMAVVDNGQASQGLAHKGLTTQLRGGTWYPGLSYSEFTGFYDIYYTTPGMRSTVDTNPSGLNVIVDGIPGNGPRSFNWPAGLPHTLDTTSPQAVGPISRLSWVDWSDGLAQMHMIMSTNLDTNYTANFVLQFAVTIDTSPAGLNVWVDGIEGPGQTFWWDDLSTHDLDVTSPQGASPTLYWWNSWSDAGAQAHTIQVTTSETITANFSPQHEITVYAWDQTNLVPLAGVSVYVDGPFAGFTPYTSWFYEGVSYDIGVEDPYNDGLNDFNFVDWDFGPMANPVSYLITGWGSITANYDQAPSSTFSLEVDPLTSTIAPGDIATYTITLTSLSGYAGDVQLSASALPGTLLPPAAATFLPNPATLVVGGQITSTLTIDNTLTVPDDTYTITVSGMDTVSAAISDSNDTELIVATPTFTMVVTPPLKTIAAGMDAKYDVTVTSVSGYTGQVGLVVSGLPGAATGSFSVDPVIVSTPGGVYVSVLTITDTGALTVGVYPFTVTGTDVSLPPIIVIDGADLEISNLPFFSMDATPVLRQVSPGDTTTFTVTATSVNTYAGDVDVSVDHLLTAADATLSWSKTMLTVLDGGSDFAVLTINTNPSILDGDYTITFYAEDAGGQNETDDSTLNISTSLPGTISGTVEDENGDPIENADVELRDDNTQLVDSTTSDSDGFYEFTDVDPGSYTVRASKTDYVDDEEPVTLAGGEDKTQDLELKFGSIEGVVVDENGDPVPDATVEIIDENGDVVGTDTTSTQGRFEVEDLFLGTYTVRISADGFKTLTEEDVEITNDEPSNDMGNTEVTEEVTGNFLADYWWLLLIIIIIVVVVILIAMLAKRKKPQPEEAPPEYATAQVPAEQAPPYQEAPAEQPPYQETPPEQYPPQEPQPETTPEEPQPEAPPEGYPPEE